MLKNLIPAAACLGICLAAPCFAADGDLDPGFGVGGFAYVTPDDIGAREIMPVVALELPDGKLLFGGTRNKILDGTPWYEPQIRAALVRLNADGSADASFGNTSIPGLAEVPDLAATRMQGIESMARMDDGSIIAVGTSMVNGPLNGTVFKLLADGTLDTSFADQGVLLLPETYLHAVGLDSQGRAIVAGERIDTSTYVNTSLVARVTEEGALDATFGDAGEVAIAWSDPTVSGYLFDLMVMPDDGVIVGGGFEAYGNGFGSDFAIARLDASGAFDTNFAESGWRVFHDPAETSNSNRIYRLALTPEHRIVFAGAHASGENLTGLVLGRLEADGSTDPTFGDPNSPGYFAPPVLPTAQTVNPNALVVQPDGKLLVSASYYAAEKQLFFAVRATADGQLDPDFADAGVLLADAAPDGVYNDSSAMTLQADGKIVVAGRAMRSADSPIVDFAAVRLLNTMQPTDRVFANGFEWGRIRTQQAPRRLR